MRDYQGGMKHILSALGLPETAANPDNTFTRTWGALPIDPEVQADIDRVTIQRKIEIDEDGTAVITTTIVGPDEPARRLAQHLAQAQGNT